MLAYLKLCLKSNSTLRVDFIGFMFVTLIIFVFRYAYFGIFFQEVDDLGGWTESEIYLLFTISILLSLLTDVFASSVHKYFDDVHKGKIEAYLVKPTPQFQVLMFRHLNMSNLLLFVLLAMVFAVYLFYYVPSNGYRVDQLVFSIFLFIVGVVVNISFVIILESFTFVSKRSLPVDYIHSELSRLTQVPITLFDSISMSTILALLPLVFSSSIIILYPT